MRQFYLLNQKHSISSELDWSDYVKLLPIKDELTRKRLVERVLKEGLSSIEIRQLVRKIRKGHPLKSALKLPPLKRPAGFKLGTFARSALSYNLPDGYVLIDCGFAVKCVKILKNSFSSHPLKSSPRRFGRGDDNLPSLRARRGRRPCP